MKGVIGIDEVGRGPLAGPVTVSACFLEDEAEIRNLIFSNTVRDSKKLTKSLRNSIYQTIRDKRIYKSRLEYAISSRSAQYIDRHGIVKAIHSCMLSCLKELKEKGINVEDTPIRLDGGLKIRNKNLHQSTHIKGDEEFVEIALASIIAKVHRDTLMEGLAKHVSVYGWEQNSGYATKFHREAIKINGITKYHRMTFLKGFELFEKADKYIDKAISRLTQ